MANDNFKKLADAVCALDIFDPTLATELFLFDKTPEISYHYLKATYYLRATQEVSRAKILAMLYSAGMMPKPQKVIFNDPATIVLWDDGTKTVVKCQDGDVYSKQTGLLMCIAKKAFGNDGKWFDILKDNMADD